MLAKRQQKNRKHNNIRKLHRKLSVMVFKIKARERISKALAGMSYKVTLWILRAGYMSIVLKKLKNSSIGLYGSTFHRENMTKCPVDIPEEM